MVDGVRGWAATISCTRARPGDATSRLLSTAVREKQHRVVTLTTWCGRNDGHAARRWRPGRAQAAHVNADDSTAGGCEGVTMVNSNGGGRSSGPDSEGGRPA